MSSHHVEHAISCYEQVLADPSASDSIRLAAFGRLLDCGDPGPDDDKLVGYVAQMLEQKDEAYRRTMMLSGLVALGVVVLMLLFVSYYYNRALSVRNDAFFKASNRLSAYRNVGSKASEDTLVSGDAAETDAEAALPNTSPQPQDDDERLFVELDGLVTRDKLFLNPDLSRDDLMRLIGVDKNRFGRMMSRYSDASNSSVYLNTHRVEYGCRLMVQHPEYTIAYIAESCGLRNTVTFNRIFKKVYGVTPSEYRTNMEEMQRNGGGKLKAKR
jgi:AraC-like DNA-binding protein